MSFFVCFEVVREFCVPHFYPFLAFYADSLVLPARACEQVIFPNREVLL